MAEPTIDDSKSHYFESYYQPPKWEIGKTVKEGKDYFEDFHPYRDVLANNTSYEDRTADAFNFLQQRLVNAKSYTYAEGIVKNHQVVTYDKLNQIKEKLNNINEIIQPTASQLRILNHKKMLLQQCRRQLWLYSAPFERCLIVARNTRESNICADRFISELDNKVKPAIIEELRKY